MKLEYSRDWVTRNTEVWKNVLGKYQHQPNIKALEIGTYEGRGAIWFLENILTHESSRLVCIDPAIKPIFFENTKQYKDKIQLINDKSQYALRSQQFLSNQFDFVYIDGSHNASDVLEDVILCFRYIARNGILIFDDYELEVDHELRGPKIAIDSFMRIFAGKYQLIHKGFQVILEIF